MYVRENWFHFLDPRVVTMIVSQEPDMSFHQAPFTWTTPASKDGLLVVMMREESLTLWAVKHKRHSPSPHQISLNIMLDDSATAQKVLETRKGSNPFRFEYECVRDWDVPVLKSALCSFQCQVVGVVSPPKLGLTTHCLVTMRKQRMRVFATLPLEACKTLMFNHGKSFARACSYEVPGY